jgi:hypothetical protein
VPAGERRPILRDAQKDERKRRGLLVVNRHHDGEHDVEEIERLRRQRWTGKQIAVKVGVSPPLSAAF